MDMVAKAFTRSLFLAGSVAMLCLPQLASAATTVASDSTALSVGLTILNGISVNLTTAYAAGTAPSAYNSNNDLVTLNTTAAIGALGALTTTASGGTDAVVDTASSTYPPTLFGTASSTVNGLNSNLTAALSIINLLHISATTLTSTSTASDPAGTLNLLGTSQVEDLRVTDAVGLGGDSGLINAGVLASTAKNNLILSALGLNVYTNYQTPVINGGITDGINTAALAVTLNNFAFGGGLLTGTILFADSQASIVGAPAAVPEIGTWAMMLVGFGLTGALARKRQVFALA